MWHGDYHHKKRYVVHTGSVAQRPRTRILVSALDDNAILLRIAFSPTTSCRVAWCELLYTVLSATMYVYSFDMVFIQKKSCVGSLVPFPTHHTSFRVFGCRVIIVSAFVTRDAFHRSVAVETTGYGHGCPQKSELEWRLLRMERFLRQATMRTRHGRHDR